ncbi:MAG: DUF4384 domain-containing protein, partial [Gemmatimonadetes bacterium]|nr:DUF4384 domain-containing protein [Gemmatimonadota bacterium]
MSAFISNVLDSSAGLWTWSGAVGLALVAGLGLAPPASAQDWDDDVRYETEEDYAYGYADDGYPELATRVWFDRGDEPLLERGDRVRVYYHASEDAFVALFHIDTNGTLRLLYPRSPEENHYVRGGRDYRLVFPTASYWRVSDDPGVGYYFSVASPEPFDFRDFRFSHYGGGWDLTEIGRRVYSDPYVAMDEVVARMIPDWDVVPYALDFATYHVERRYEYPRFLCYDCHGFRPYASWNPYIASCTSFRVVVYDDPYFYPATRYVGTRVVYTRPARVGLPRFEFKERARGEAAAPLVIERSARPTSAGTRGVSGRSAVPRTEPARLDGRRPVRTRPSEVLPGRTPSPTVRRGGSATRPTLE